MKKIFSLSTKAGWSLMIACFSAIVLLSSCMKDPEPEPVGEAKVRFVNAAYASTSQDYYVNGTKKNSLPLAYGQASDYVTITSGYNQFVFANEGTTVSNGGIAATVSIGSTSTLFSTKSLLNEVDVVGYQDDMTAPAAGKAKVRFVHLNHFLSSSITGTIEGGEQKFTGLGFQMITPYYSVDANTKFVVSATGVTTAPAIDAGIVAGKIYTIWLDGSAVTELKGHVIVQN